MRKGEQICSGPKLALWRLPCVACCLPRWCSRASKLIGADVENPSGQNLGDIKDIVLDPQTGQIAYAVLGFGGFLGMGEKYFAIPWTALSAKEKRPGEVDK